MRFAVAHKAATYLMVGFAYLAMIAGGGVSPLIALGGLVGLVGSWWWEPPTIQFERWAWLWTTASVFALVYSVLTAIVTGDFLGVGAQFLIWLIVAKAYNRRAALPRRTLSRSRTEPRSASPSSRPRTAEPMPRPWTWGAR